MSLSGDQAEATSNGIVMGDWVDRDQYEAAMKLFSLDILQQYRLQAAHVFTVQTCEHIIPPTAHVLANPVSLAQSDARDSR